MHRKLHIVVLSAFLLGSAQFGCTGGQEGSAAETNGKGDGTAARQANKPVPLPMDGSKLIAEIGPAVPLYTGASYRDDLSERDSRMIQNQYGPGAKAYTLVTEDSFPQVYHYYVTYLAQFRSFRPLSPFPPYHKEWRSVEVNLNASMQDPFIPEATINASDKQVILQISETESDPPTMIRYILAPKGVTAPVAAP